MKRISLKLYLTITICSLAVFVFTGICTKTGLASLIDDPVQAAFYNARSDGLTAFVSMYTHLGDASTVIIFLVALLVCPLTFRKYGIPLSLTAIGSIAAFKIAKLIFARPRPNEALRLITEGGFSFPSGHTLNNLVVMGFLAFLILSVRGVTPYTKAASAALICYAVSIALSRIYLFVHYPSDIIGGWALGIAVLASACYIYQRIEDTTKHNVCDKT